MTPIQYMKFKQQQTNAALKKTQDARDGLNSRLDHKQGIGLGHGYATDMNSALQQVRDFQYTPSQEEIHYRRVTSGQWIDNPPVTKTK